MTLVTDYIWDKLGKDLSRFGFTNPSELKPGFDLLEHGVLDSLAFLNFLEEMADKLDCEYEFEEDEISTIGGIIKAFHQKQKGTGFHAQSISVREMSDTLASIGLEEGNVVVVHVGMHLIGDHELGAEGLFKAIHNVVGDRGCIAVPAANISAYKLDDFDATNTPVDTSVGMFPEYVRQLDASVRSRNPIDSMCAIGMGARDLCAQNNQRAYDGKSPWVLACGMQAYSLYIGVDFIAASPAHVSEIRANVPYRKWEKVLGKERHNDKVELGDYELFARNTQTDYNFSQISGIDSIKNILVRKQIGHGMITMISYTELVDNVTECLLVEPEYLLTSEG